MTTVIDTLPLGTGGRRARVVVLAVTALAVVMLLAATAGATIEPAVAAPSVQSLVDRWRARTPVHAVTVAIDEPGRPVHTIASGRDGDRRVTADTRFRVGSITKTFVATVILQLADERRLRLDDPLDRHVPTSPWGDVMLRQLLTHTGGVPDYTQAAGFNDSLLDRPTRRWATADVLDLVADRERSFAPGTGHEYSNTGYVLLGQVIEAVTGHSWQHEMRQRIIEPLGLRDTSIAGFDDTAADAVTGWIDTSGDGFDDPVRGEWPALDTTEGPAGALLSTAPDLATFARALFEGDLLSRDARREMTAPGPFHPPRSNYGLGVELRRPDHRTIVWGHGGSMPGWRSTLWYEPGSRRVIVVLANAYRCATDDLAQLLLLRAGEGRLAAHRAP